MPDDFSTPSSRSPEQSNPANTPTPPPPSDQAPPAPAPHQQASQGSGLPPSVAAGLAELFTLIGGIIFYMIDRRQPLVRFHAMQSIYFGATCIVVFVIISIISVVPVLGWIVGVLLWLAAVIAFGIMWIIAVFKAFNGIEWEMPFIGQLARQQIKKGSV